MNPRQLAVMLGVVYAILGVLNSIGIASFDRVTIFCLALGSFLLTLGFYFEGKVGLALSFVGVFSLFGLTNMGITEGVKNQLETWLNEDTMLLLTLSVTFMNIQLAYKKELNYQLMIKNEYRNGGIDALEKLWKELGK